MALPLKIALRFLKNGKWQTLLIIIGISIGISVQIFVGLLLNSLQSSLLNNFIGNSSQITITSDTENPLIDDYDDIVDELEEFDELTAISVTNERPATVIDGTDSYNIILKGFEFDDADEIYNIAERIDDGEEPDDDFEAIIGVDLNDELDYEEGDNIIISGFIENESVTRTFEVVGFFDLEIGSINSAWVITTLESVQEMFNTSDTVTSIEMQIKQEVLYEADEIADDIEDELDLEDENLKISNWIDENENLLNGLQSQSLSSYFIQSFVLISVVIGIDSVLAISVVQKQRQLGILKAMGITNRTASLIFIFQGLFLGIFGAIGGIALGIFFLWGFTQASPSDFIIINYDPIFISISAAIIIVSSVIAALSPAIKSSKLDPIDIIRGE
ncbi:MAG: ABC transporter permease [Promethearchaeota archaeon]|nr:MAG: ABC transporter permease [Candidatus Lokiarchaeota archaeon]